MTKIVEVYRHAPYKVVTSKDGVKSILVQVVKEVIAKQKLDNEDIIEKKVEHVIEQYEIFIAKDDGSPKQYEFLDKELDRTLTRVISSVKHMATKESLGDNLLNKLEKKYNGT